jgi:hypothetical protein
VKRQAFGLLWLCCIVSGWAQTQALPTTPVYIEERQRIEAERVREGANFDAQEAACYQRFAVNDCLIEVQVKRISVLADLKRQESRLHDHERNQQGTEALNRLELKALERRQWQEENQVQKGVGRAQERLKEQQEKQADHAARAVSDPAPVTVPAPSGPTDAEQAQARARYTRRQIDAQKKRQELIKRQADKTSKPAKSLPNPP